LLSNGDDGHAVDNSEVIKWHRREITWRQLWNLSLSRWQAVLGWIGASFAFLLVAEFLGGTSYPDLYESIYATQGIAHGHFGCLFPATNLHLPTSISPDSSVISPLYPLVSGGLSAVLRIGHSVSFPAAAGMATHCARALVAMNAWINLSSATWPTMRLAYLSWFVLLAGCIVVLHTSQHRRRVSEVAMLILIAVLPPVFMCIGFVFHPEYLLAAGLAICSVGVGRKNWWLLSGAFMGLAILSQQFAVLVAAVLVVAVVQRREWRWFIGLVASVSLVVVPLAIATSGRAIGVSILGSSRVTPFASSNIRATGGTVLWELHLHGTLLFVIARVCPILGALVLSLWVRRKRGPIFEDPVVLMSLVTAAFSLRLVFEENLFGYYFMATAVSLILLDAVIGRIRGQVIIWVSLVTLAFNPIPSGFASRWAPWGNQAIPFMNIVFVAVLLILVAHRARQGRVPIYVVATLLFTLVVFHTQIFYDGMSRQTLPHWLWQVILVPWSLVLALRPIGNRESEKVSPGAAQWSVETPTGAVSD
jgi:hypothetical protein